MIVKDNIGRIMEVPYIIEDWEGSDGTATCELVEHEPPYVRVFVFDTNEELLIAEESECREL